MVSSREAMIVILARKDRSRAEQKRVDERIRAGLCLMKIQDGNGELVDCPSAITASRGNCIACENAFEDFLKTLDPEHAVRAEQDAMARGWRLRRQEIREIRSKYPFAKLG